MEDLRLHTSIGDKKLCQQEQKSKPVLLRISSYSIGSNLGYPTVFIITSLLPFFSSLTFFLLLSISFLFLNIFLKYAQSTNPLIHFHFLTLLQIKLPPSFPYLLHFLSTSPDFIT